MSSLTMTHCFHIKSHEQFWSAEVCRVCHANREQQLRGVSLVIGSTRLIDVKESMARNICTEKGIKAVYLDIQLVA